jgi:hypothetical protein
MGKFDEEGNLTVDGVKKHLTHDERICGFRGANEQLTPGPANRQEPWFLTPTVLGAAAISELFIVAVAVFLFEFFNGRVEVLALFRQAIPFVGQVLGVGAENEEEAKHDDAGAQSAQIRSEQAVVRVGMGVQENEQDDFDDPVNHPQSKTDHHHPIRQVYPFSGTIFHGGSSLNVVAYFGPNLIPYPCLVLV